MQRLASAFHAPYVGGAFSQFRDYLCSCWSAYKDAGARMFPYVTAMQSSGFGKSRLLHEVAKSSARTSSRASRTEPKLMDGQASEGEIRVLYVCARDIRRSSGFPVATPDLKTWFLKSEAAMEDRLMAAFEYADAHWDEVGEQWLGLFDDPNADAEVCNALSSALGTAPAAVVDPSQRPLKRARLAGDRAESSGSYSGGSSTRADIPARSLNVSTGAIASSSDAGAGAAKRDRLLVLVIDEARPLIETQAQDGVNYLRHLRRALRDATSESGPLAATYLRFLSIRTRRFKNPRPRSREIRRRERAHTSRRQRCSRHLR